MGVETAIGLGISLLSTAYTVYDSEKGRHDQKKEKREMEKAERQAELRELQASQEADAENRSRRLRAAISGRESTLGTGRRKSLLLGGG